MTTATVSCTYIRQPRTTRTPRFLRSLATTFAVIGSAVEAARAVETASTPDRRRQLAETFINGRTI